MTPTESASSGREMSTPSISAPMRPATGLTVMLAILGYLLEDRGETGFRRCAEERGDVVVRSRARAGHQRDDLLQGALDGAADRHVVGGAARGEDDLGDRRRLVLDADVVVGDPLRLVGLLPVLGLDDALEQVVDRRELVRAGQGRVVAEEIVVAGRADRVD